MSRLHVYLCLDSLPGPSPPYLVLLKQLAQLSRFRLTVINNGQAFEPRRMFHQLGLSCKFKHYPICFHPAQVLLDLLESEEHTEPVLWLQDRLLWHPQALLSWRKQLDEWAWISPHLLPEKALIDTRRLYQQQALSAPDAPGRLELAQPHYFPPCLYFGPDSQSVLIDWLQPQGQLPLLQLVAHDLGSAAWHPAPSSEPTRTEFVLESFEAIERWEQAQAMELPVTRRLALLSSLQRAFPQSPQVYEQLLPLLSPAEIISLVQPLLKRDWLYPYLLDYQAQALAALGHEATAADLEAILKIRYPAYTRRKLNWEKIERGEIEIWGQESLPRAATLSVCIVLQAGEHGLLKTLESVASLALEKIVIATCKNASEIQAARERGAQVYVISPAPLGDLKQAALQQACGNWVLFLEAGEVLSPESQLKLRQWLWHTSPGLGRFMLKIQTRNQVGEICLTQHEIRLFPRHRMFVFQGLCAELCFQGPAQTRLELLDLEVFQDQLKQAQRPSNWPAPEDLAWDALAYWGRLAFCLAEFERASAYFRACLNLEATSVQFIMQLQMEWLWSLWCLGQYQRCATLLPGLEAVQNHPEYAYFLGLLRLQQGDSASALRSFQASMQAGKAIAFVSYDPRKIKLWPAVQLFVLWRKQVLQSESSPRERASAAPEALEMLKYCLKQFPSGVLPQHEDLPQSVNLYLCLAELAWVGGRLLLESPLALFQAALPEQAPLYNTAFHAETALLFLEQKSAALADRLPPDLGFEALQDMLRNPSLFYRYMESLWQRVEIGGAELAEALLYIVSVARQDIPLFLLLCRLWESVQQSFHSRQALMDLQSYFGADPYLLHYYAKLLMQSEDLPAAEERLTTALAQFPDFEPLQALSQELQRRKGTE